MNDILDDTVPTPAWCSAHDSIGELFSDGSGSCMYSHIVEMGSGECLLQAQRLVPVDALVIVRDADGNWPIPVIAALSAATVRGMRRDTLRSQAFSDALDALAEAAKENPQ